MRSEHDLDNNTKLLRAAWRASGLSHKAIAARCGCTAGAVNNVMTGASRRGPARERIVALLMRGEVPVTSAPAVMPAPQVISLPPRTAEKEDLLILQAMAAEELAEAARDLACLRQAERRWDTAVEIARRVGLQVVTPDRVEQAA